MPVFGILLLAMVTRVSENCSIVEMLLSIECSHDCENLGQLALLIFQYCKYWDDVDLLVERRPYVSHHEKSIAIDGEHKVRSILESEPVAGWIYVDCFKFKIDMLLWSKTFSTTCPLRLSLEFPHNGWWALKSPINIKGGGRRCKREATAHPGCYWEVRIYYK